MMINNLEGTRTNVFSKEDRKRRPLGLNMCPLNKILLSPSVQRIIRVGYVVWHKRKNWCGWMFKMEEEKEATSTMIHFARWLTACIIKMEFTPTIREGSHRIPRGICYNNRALNKLAFNKDFKQSQRIHFKNLIYLNRSSRRITYL